MPRAFNEQERERIRGRLLAQGRALLASYGIRKTSVDDLASAAGIAKGSFYAFFQSKEELFFAVFEQFEAEYQAHLLETIDDAGAPPATRLRRFIEHALSAWRDDPLFRRFGGDEYRQLLSGLSPERVTEHLGDDQAFARQVIGRFAATGAALHCTAAELTYLMRVLFLVSLHADDFGSEAYHETINLLIEMTIARITANEGYNHD